MPKVNRRAFLAAAAGAAIAPALPAGPAGPAAAASIPAVTSRGGGRGAAGAGDTRGGHRTLLVRNTTPGDDIADHTTVCASAGPCVGIRVVGVLRKGLDSDLTIRLRIVSIAGTDTAIECTIPAATIVNDPIVFTDWETLPDTQPFLDGDVLIWDIVEGDTQSDGNGVAAFTVEWR